jgi:hypothetical protein
MTLSATQVNAAGTTHIRVHTGSRSVSLQAAGACLLCALGQWQPG